MKPRTNNNALFQIKTKIYKLNMIYLVRTKYLIFSQIVFFQGPQNQHNTIQTWEHNQKSIQSYPSTTTECNHEHQHHQVGLLEKNDESR